MSFLLYLSLRSGCVFLTSDPKTLCASWCGAPIACRIPLYVLGNFLLFFFLSTPLQYIKKRRLAFVSLACSVFLPDRTPPQPNPLVRDSTLAPLMSCVAHLPPLILLFFSLAFNQAYYFFSPVACPPKVCRTFCTFLAMSPTFLALLSGKSICSAAGYRLLVHFLSLTPFLFFAGALTVHDPWGAYFFLP